MDDKSNKVTHINNSSNQWAETMRNYNPQLVEVENEKRTERLANIAQDEIEFISTNFDINDNVLEERYAAAASVEWEPGNPYLTDCNGKISPNFLEDDDTMAITDAKFTLSSPAGVHRKMAIYHPDEIDDHHLAHEMLHILSTEVNTFFGVRNQGYVKNGLRMIGFNSSGEVVDKNLNAVALNEGVTELLTSKIDHKIEFKNKEYDQFRDLADILVGSNSKKLVQAYFSDNEQEFKEFLNDFEQKQEYTKGSDLVNLSPDGVIDPKVLHACVAYNRNCFKDPQSDIAKQEYLRTTKLADKIDMRNTEILRQKMQERVIWDDLDTDEGCLALLRTLAPDQNGFQYPSAYTAICHMGMEQKNNLPQIPKWQDLTKKIINHNVRHIYDWIKKRQKHEPESLTGTMEEFLDRVDTMLNHNLLHDGSFAEIYNNPNYQKLTWRPVVMQGGNHFAHCRNFVTKTPDFSRSHGVEARLYMSPQTENMIPLIQEMINKYDQHDMRYYFKFSNRTDRNDRMVIYTDYQHIDQHLNVLQEIQNEHPELFNNMKKNPLWGKIKNGPQGVYFGEEPKNGRVESYSGLRSKAIARAYNRFIKASGWYKKDNDPNDKNLTDQEIQYNNIVAKQPYDVMLLNFRNMVMEEAEKLGIGEGTKGFCFNKDE